MTSIVWAEDEAPAKPKRKKKERPMPPIPETGWRAPELPNAEAVANAPFLALDCETYDPDLKNYGPGWARGTGHIIGVSIAVPGARWYFPIRHETCPEQNLDPGKVLAWLRVALGNKKQPKIGANITYDAGWLRQEGVRVEGYLLDVQYAEALLDEAASVSLEALGQKYLGEGKETSALYDWLAEWKGGKPTSDMRKWLYLAPPSLVGPYAEQDADLPLRLWPILRDEMRAKGLSNVFGIETRLIPLMLDMRFTGVRVNVPAAERLRDELILKEGELAARLNALAGSEVRVSAARSLAKAYDAQGIKYGTTATGMPSFTKEWLAAQSDPLSKLVNDIRSVNKLRTTFIESYIIDSNVKGRLHCSFHQLRSDDLGTRSGRFSSSDPNLQNVPSRDDVLAPLIRGLFLHDTGHVAWRKFDYSSIEYRMLAHFAVGDGADALRAVYAKDPTTDYHDLVLSLVGPEAGWDISTPELRKKWRKPLKNINFGLIYGMGQAKLGRSLGLDRPATRALFAAYHRGAPFAKTTMDAVARMAARQGFIQTVLGRRSYFDLWSPRDGWERPLPLNLAREAYGEDLERASLHKALNRLLQGSAADVMKAAMLKNYEDGVFDETGVPKLTVHDELDFSDPGGKEEAFRQMQHNMENVIPLSVPLIADGEIGPDWGHVK